MSTPLPPPHSDSGYPAPTSGLPPPGFTLQPPPVRWVLPKDAYTPWSKRMLASFIDWIPIWLVVVPWIGFLISSDRHQYCRRPSPRCSPDTSGAWALALGLAVLAAAVYFFWNFCHRQGKTGQSIGKSMLKFKVVSNKTWQPIGFGLSLVRQLAHHLDQTVCYVGYLFPLWDDQRQTLADKIMSTVCVPVTPPPPQPGAGTGVSSY